MRVLLFRLLAVCLLAAGCKSSKSGGTAYLEGHEQMTPGLYDPLTGELIEPPAPLVLRAQPVGGEELFTNPASWNLPGADVSLNDAARMLAGMDPAGYTDGFADVRRTRAWLEHRMAMDKLWQDYTWRHEQPIRQWAASEMPDIARGRSLFYPFSGPDFLFAQAFFPRVETLVLCGLEPAETLPAMNRLSPQDVGDGLAAMRTALNSVMQFSFFITKDMRNDLVASRFRGVLPVLLVFMARSGYRVETVDAVRVAADGNAVITQLSSGSAPGLLIRCRARNGALVRVFYIRQNLADDSIKPGHPFLKFVSETASGAAFVKSASYLMHESYFSNIRNFLLNNIPAVVQDPSGIPYRMIDQSVWDIRLYGNYQRTLSLFGEKTQQPDLREAYETGRHGAQPLPFGIGYLYQPEATSLMVLRRFAR
jgi:hypothetical protein